MPVASTPEGKLLVLAGVLSTAVPLGVLTTCVTRVLVVHETAQIKP